MKGTWHKSIVLKGDRSGRTIGYPTLNLDINIDLSRIEQGVYSSVVRYKSREYIATLYFGPRLVKNETANVLEIYVHDFSEVIYGEEIEFTIGQFIRPVMAFASLDELKTQIQIDVDKTKKSFI